MQSLSLASSYNTKNGFAYDLCAEARVAVTDCATNIVQYEFRLLPPPSTAPYTHLCIVNKYLLACDKHGTCFVLYDLQRGSNLGVYKSNLLGKDQCEKSSEIHELINGKDGEGMVYVTYTHCSDVGIMMIDLQREVLVAFTEEEKEDTHLSNIDVRNHIVSSNNPNHGESGTNHNMSLENDNKINDQKRGKDKRRKQQKHVYSYIHRLPLGPGSTQPVLAPPEAYPTGGRTPRSTHILSLRVHPSRPLLLIVYAGMPHTQVRHCFFFSISCALSLSLSLSLSLLGGQSSSFFHA